MKISAGCRSRLNLLARKKFAYAEQIALIALKSLLYEVSVTPKPGLVDRANCGAHNDMDFFTFLDSSCALLPYFREITLFGITFEGEPCELLPLLRPIGLRAEQTMRAATGGVNTHKGLLFSLGILCAAQGYRYAHELDCGANVSNADANEPDGDVYALLALCAEIAQNAPQELRQAHAHAAPTAGEAAFLCHGLTGARGEAASGFASVRRHGYPVFRHLLACGCCPNDAGAVTLLNLMAHVDDTNIIKRSGLTRLTELQAQIQSLLQTGNVSDLLTLAASLDQTLIAEHLSPGGCADLLSITFFLWMLP